MNRSFKRLPFPVKLSIIAVLPLIFLVYLAYELHVEKQERISVVQSFSQRIEETAAITSLIDRLQTERRYSHAYLLSGLMQSEMLLARAEVNSALQVIDQNGSSRLKNLRSFSIVDNLPALRRRADEKDLTGDELMDLYTKIIIRLNVLSMVSTENIPYLEELNDDLRGQRILSQIVTYVGILRGNLYQAFYLKKANPQNLLQLRHDYLVFISLENEFMRKAAPDAVTEYEQIKRSRDVSEMMGVLALMGKPNSTLPIYNVAAWWTVSANAVDAIRALQRKLLDRVKQSTQVVYKREHDKKNRNLLFLIIAISLVVFILTLTIGNITRSLNSLKDFSEQIALGRTGATIDIPGNDAIGKLARSIMLIETNSVELANAASQIGKGNFNIDIRPRSSDDVLGNAVVTMKNDLQRFRTDNAQKIWLQDGLNVMNESIRGEMNIDELTSSSLSALAGYINAGTALFYVTQNNHLQYSAGYAVADERAVPQNLRIGESLVGQVAREKKIMVLNDVPETYLRITSGSGGMRPLQLLIVPLEHNGTVEGVIELTSLEPFSAQVMQLIESATPVLAISLQVARNRARLKELLEETQVQSEELQTQHNELEHLNSELEMQSQKLQASEEELRVQQEELQQTNKELEHRSSLLEEKNDEIRKKAEELEQTTKYKSEFLANVSHELRTPLNSILLLSRLLHENNDKNLNEEQLEYARVIQSSGSGLLALIDEILDLSKIEAGKMQLEYLQVPMREIVADLEPMFRPLAAEKNIGFSITLSDDLPESMGTDKTRLEQILKNLISNALKFTSQGNVKVQVRPHPSRPGIISFDVTDTGIGIPHDKQHLVFEAFQQADGSTKRKYGGTGLGLSISRELAKLLGGDITLESEPGKGSTFSLHLPVSSGFSTGETERPKEEVTRPAMTDKYISKTIPESIPDDRNSLKSGDRVILIIEDDTGFAKSLLDYTRKRGYKGIVAVRGDEGIELARRYRPMGILLDIQLPVKSGWTVIDELKADHATRHIPVHMMSSYHEKKESLMKGAVDFIDKPLAYEQMQEIFSKIEYVLHKKSRKVMIVEDNPKHAKALAYFLGTFNINSELKSNISEGVKALGDKEVDCVIMDMGVPDAKAYETLEEAKKSPEFGNVPIIIFTGKSLSRNEELKIRKYADSIIVKTANSYQRMIDEVGLFLHHVDENRDKSDGSRKLGAMSDVLEGKTVLIADDDVRNIYSLSKALENYKVNVITAIDGKEALQKLEENTSVDLVLLDMMMPEMDGYETARKIRENSLLKDLPVIAVTAKAMSGDREKCINAGASDYITKPVDIDQLVSLLRVWMYERT